MSEHEDFYNQWVGPQITELKSGQKEIITYLKGSGTNPGMCDEVRDNTRFRKRFIWVILTAVCAVIVQTAAAIRRMFFGA